MAIAIVIYSFVSSAAPLVDGIPPEIVCFIKGLPKVPWQWAVISFLAAIAFIAIEGGYRLREKDRARSISDVSQVQAKLDEERSAKNAPDVLIEFAASALMLQNRSADRDAHNISFPTITGRDYKLEAEDVPRLDSGGMAPLRVWCTKNGETSLWSGEVDPFEFEKTAMEMIVPVAIEFNDRLGRVTYVAKFEFVFNRLLKPKIRHAGLLTKPISQ